MLKIGTKAPEYILPDLNGILRSLSQYVRIDQNKLYWVKGEENGAIDIW
jgi:hypothetical protein